MSVDVLAPEVEIDVSAGVDNAISEANALKAEGYAVGTQDGTPVASGSPYYENNAKHYAEEAAASLAEITDLSASATTLAAGSSATASYNANTGVLSLGIPRGPKGDPGNGVPYGVCSTAAATQEKAVTISGISELADGQQIRVKFTNAQNYSGTPTLNVNSLGAKSIQRCIGTDATQGEWLAGEYIDLVYDGTNTKWVIVGEAALKTSLNNLVIPGPRCPASGNYSAALARSWVSCSGLTSSYCVANWGLSTGTVGNPPADITIEEGTNGFYLTIENYGGTAFYFKPIFILST